jgi:SLOG in TRPM
MSQYVRVDYSTPPEKIWKLMETQWKMAAPKLIISIAGGLRTTFVKPRLLTSFKRGLIAAVTSAGNHKSHARIASISHQQVYLVWRGSVAVLQIGLSGREPSKKAFFAVVMTNLHLNYGYLLLATGLPLT